MWDRLSMATCASSMVCLEPWSEQNPERSTGTKQVEGTQTDGGPGGDSWPGSINVISTTAGMALGVVFSPRRATLGQARLLSLSLMLSFPPFIFSLLFASVSTRDRATRRRASRRREARRSLGVMD